VDVLEDSVRVIGQPDLTPSDVVNAFNIILNEKYESLQKKAMTSPEDVKELDLSNMMDLNSFRTVGKKLKAYAAGEQTEAAKKSVRRVKPKETYKDVGGLKGVRDEIIKEISLALNPDLAAKTRYIPPKGFIFHGPPGTGKTLLAKAIAGENNVFFYNINGPSLIQGMYGESEKTVRDIFSDARKNSPALIFFDEIDSIAPRRGTHDPVIDRVTSQLLTELDGFVPLQGVVVIGTTNRLDVLDPALLERFTRHFEFTYPKDSEERKEIIDIHLKNYIDCLDKELYADKKPIYEIFERKMLSPRKIADTINDANRLRVKELEAADNLLRAYGKKDLEDVKEISRIFQNDLKRLFEITGMGDYSYEQLGTFVGKLEKIKPADYPLKLYHFEKALELTKEEKVEEMREMMKSAVLNDKPEIGKSYGLVAVGEEGRGGGIVCPVEAIISHNGVGKIKVIGSEMGESIKHSAEAVYEYLNDLTDYKMKEIDIAIQLVTPLMGTEKQPVAPGITMPSVQGPSAGLAIGVAIISQLLEIPIDPTSLITGGVTVKGEAWPVGGLDYRSMAKIEATMEYENVKRLLIPKYNFDKLGESSKEYLKKRNIEVIGVENLLEAASYSLLNNPKIDDLKKLLREKYTKR
jgi:AAA+ superfamily predicted ATPase